MRQQVLTGYVLHQRPYQENRSLTYFLSKEFGVVHGIGKKNLPMFLPISVFANGKTSLKTFSQSQVTTITPTLTGQAMYAGLYLNELLLKLLPVEEAVTPIFIGYQQCLAQIGLINQHVDDASSQLTYLKWYLRQFETLLLEELGYGFDFLHDAQQQTIDVQAHYVYQLQQGFKPVFPSQLPGDAQSTDYSITGDDIAQWHDLLNSPERFNSYYQQNKQAINALLNQFGKIYRQVIDHLLNYQALQSRELWQQLIQLQT